jgi:DNA-binding response OmpR family regulator
MSTVAEVRTLRTNKRVQAIPGDLQMLGHEAEHAATVHEALEKLERFRPECVMLDLTLPDGSGVAILQEIRTRGLPAKVAVMTALHRSEPRIEQLRPLRPDVIFQKPLELARVHDWLAAQR